MRRDKHKFEKSKRRQEIKELKTLRSVISTISTHLFHGERLDQTQIGDEKRLNEKGSDLWASKGPMSPTSVGFSLTIALVQNTSEMFESKKKKLELYNGIQKY
jgi:hypothetical protein